MTQTPVATVILAAGKGTRMKSARPKGLHEVGGKPMVEHILASVRTLEPTHLAVVVGPGMEALTEAVAPIPTPVQSERLGTAHALGCVRGSVAGFDHGAVLVIFGDSPFIRPETLRRMVDLIEAGASVVILGFEPEDPKKYGRLVVDDDGQLQAIVEVWGRGDDIRSIRLCNSGVTAVAADRLWELVDGIGNDNAKGEYYLTDIVAVARQKGLDCRYVLAEEWELLGIDSRAGLAAAETQWQRRARLAAMDGGATLRDPETIYLSWDTVLGRDVTIGQNVVLGPGVTIEDKATILPFCHLEDCVVKAGAKVGPFARLRGGAEIGEDAKIGTFVESKNGKFGPGAKANHLAYVGDAVVGAKANIGAGVITCNYDGVLKHRTVIGDESFIGSNASLVAPVTIGERALVGAGSTITKDVAPDAIAATRSPQKEAPGAATKRKARLQAIKDAQIKK